jgi:hypothetical protein
MSGSVAYYVRQHHVGILALFIALSGTAYAATLPRNSVGTPQLKKDAVTTKKLKNGEVRRADIGPDAVNAARVKDFSLTASDFKLGQLPAGPQGPKGDPGATNLRVRKAAGFNQATVECQPGERATGGGAHSVNGFIWASVPAANPEVIHTVAPIEFQGFTPTSWTAAADGAEPPGTPADVTVWVVCAAP